MRDGETIDAGTHPLDIGTCSSCRQRYLSRHLNLIHNLALCDKCMKEARKAKGGE